MAVLAGAVVAQPAPQANIEVLSERLELDDAQTAEVSEILATQGEKRRELMQTARSGGRTPELRTKMVALRDETDALLSEVLNAEQMSEYREIAAARREAMRARRLGR